MRSPSRPADDFRRDSDLFAEARAPGSTRGGSKAALKRGFQTRSAELDLARLLGELIDPRGSRSAAPRPAKGATEVTRAFISAEDGRDQLGDRGVDGHGGAPVRVEAWRAFIMSITPWIASSPPTPRMAAPKI